MKKHIRNKKAIGAIVIGGAILSVGSVGFASWVIAGGDVEATGNDIGVEVGAIVDKRVTISDLAFSNVDSDGTDSTKTIVKEQKACLVFGPTYNDDQGLIKTPTGSNDIEHLSVSFDFNIKCSNLLTVMKSIYIAPTFPALLTTLSTKNYVANPPIESSIGTGKISFDLPANYNGSEQTYTYSSAAVSNKYTLKLSGYNATAGTIKASVKVAWAWGTAFDSKNPSLRDTSSELDDTLTKLNDLNSVITNETNKTVSFKVGVAVNS